MSSEFRHLSILRMKPFLEFCGKLFQWSIFILAVKIIQYPEKINSDVLREKSASITTHFAVEVLYYSVYFFVNKRC